MSLTTLVLATRNQGKTREITDLLSGRDIVVKNLSDFGPIPEVVEDGETFEENAYKKASFTARVLGFPALADDSGLVVEALEGAPGVYSARYGGEGLSDKDRCLRLLAQMKDKTDRGAHFACVLSLAVPEGYALTWEGRCDGLITREPDGEKGFGYDPVFYYPPLEKTFARMDRQEKNQVSHRGLALAEMAGEWKKVSVWLDRHMPPSGEDGCLGKKGGTDS